MTKSAREKPIIVSLQRFDKTPWLWDFFEQQCQMTADKDGVIALTGSTRWLPGVTHEYNGIVFKFENLLLARRRRNTHDVVGVAYEEISPRSIAHDGSAEVYPILCTLSMSRDGLPNVKDKKRLVKFQHPRITKRESEVTIHAEHLHSKFAEGDFFVMRKMEGQTLRDFFLRNALTRKDTFNLLKALAGALKSQVSDRGMRHGDLHGGNVMVKCMLNEGEKQFIVNIIDYGYASKDASLSDPAAPNHDWIHFSQYFSRHLFYQWEELTPSSLFEIPKLAGYSTTSLHEFIEAINAYVLLPIERSQPSLDKLYLCINTLPDKALARQLRSKLQQAAAECTETNVESLNMAVRECESILSSRGIVNTVFSESVFDHQPEVHNIYYNIFKNVNQLAIKGEKLIEKGLQTEGQGLKDFALELRRRIFLAATMPRSERAVAMLGCYELCTAGIERHDKAINLHRDNGYILAETLSVAGLLVLPYLAYRGYNYATKGKFTFFGETNTAKSAEELQRDLTNLSSHSEKPT